MSLSVLDIFKIGLGPSSSHTMGPMNAAAAFVADLVGRGLLGRTERVGVQLYGSLALTGLGHCTDRAVLLGLEGHRPDRIEPESIEPTLARIRATGRLRLAGSREIGFDEPLDLLLHRDQTLPLHTNGMRFTALDATGGVLHREEYYSVGPSRVGTDRRCRTRSGLPRSCSRPVASRGSNCTSSCLPTSGRFAPTRKLRRHCCGSGR